MRVLFLSENYHGFYNRYLAEHPELKKESYLEQCSKLFGQYFYQSDSYVYGVKRLGHEAYQVIVDCDPLQYKWAREHRFFVPPLWTNRPPWRWYWTRLTKRPYPLDQILLEQIKQIRPDILYIFSGVFVNEKLLSRARQYARYLVCQWACPYFKNYPFGSYDLIITSTRTLVKRFHKEGYKVEYLPHAFDERVLAKINGCQKRNGIVFVGLIKPSVYKERLRLLEYLASHIEFDFYGTGVNYLPKDSPLHKRFCGEAFGLEMYQIYSRYKIAIQSHPEVTGSFVGGKRLFEITGAGTMLLTDTKEDLNNFFEVGKEAVAYTDPADCLNKLRYYLAHEDERAEIAQAGQRRTLREHTFPVRMKELADIFEKTFSNI